MNGCSCFSDDNFPPSSFDVPIKSCRSGGDRQDHPLSKMNSVYIQITVISVYAACYRVHFLSFVIDFERFSKPSVWESVLIVGPLAATLKTIVLVISRLIQFQPHSGTKCRAVLIQKKENCINCLS